MSSKKKGKEGKFVKFMKGPVKILAGARDLYERSLSGCAGHAAVQNAMGPSTCGSFSLHSSRDEDMKELIRIASTGKSVAEHLPSPSPVGGAAAVLRSRTVNIGRIDEDKPCEFGGDLEVHLKSRSTAASRRRSMV